MVGQHANGRQGHLGPNPQRDRGGAQIMEPEPRPGVAVFKFSCAEAEERSQTHVVAVAAAHLVTRLIMGWR